ncbi:sterol desaturase family protein [Pseudomonas sp. NA-150]|uniref:sterol desaturase family protein n=1 Tax=Pseudomonas sp. NA-150 TaxID=3367525 RepID=UPI0037C799C0
MNFSSLYNHASSGALPWLFGLLLIVLVAATLEGLVQTFVRHKAYDWKAYAASMADAIARRGIDALGLSIAAPILAWAYAHRINTLELNTPLAIFILFIGQEFLYYWYHRASHTINWFWATHSVHHSPNELTLASALRLGWTGKLTGTTLFFTPLIWIGFSPTAVLSVVAGNLLYQFWLHAPWMPKLGPLEWVFNTPTHHKVHHASNPEYLDRNYGGVLIIFDRLFGTFADEREDVTIRYGLTEPLKSHNPLRIALHGWMNMGKKIGQAHSWRDRVKAVFGPP